MKPAAVFHSVFEAMGTRFSLVLPDVEDAEGATIASWIENEVLAQERLMSRFDFRSPVAELNRRAAQDAVPTDPALWEILEDCEEHAIRSRRAFDIAQSSARDVMIKTRPRITLDSTARSVRFESADVQIDLGGIGKGIALEKVAAGLRRRGIQRAFLSFGESSITVLGSHPAGPPWPVGIADLFRPEVAAHTFHLRDASVSTSGNRPGQNPHIINRDGSALAECRTMSVASPSAIEAEVLSTALLTLPQKERAAVMANYPNASAVEIAYDSATNGGLVTWKHEC